MMDISTPFMGPVANCHVRVTGPVNELQLRNWQLLGVNRENALKMNCRSFGGVLPCAFCRIRQDAIRTGGHGDSAYMGFYFNRVGLNRGKQQKRIRKRK
jgi:hypothetical protein